MANLIGFMAFFAVLFVTGWMQQRAVNKWAERTGRAPMINKGRGSWGRYMEANRYEMPASLLKRISVLTWIGYLAIALFILFAVGVHRR